ncbi:hypothetical protein JCM21900_005569 [Sporobolomyces salmonicolor]
MPHADSLALPEGLSKAEFYSHVCATLEALLTPGSPDDPAANWITCFSNAASLLYGSFENREEDFGRQDGRRVNWAGFYVTPSLLSASSQSTSAEPTQLLLGPFHGRPACLSVSLQSTPSRPVGVCAAAFLSGETVVVPNVDERPGHIACDGVTKSEIVVPVMVRVKRADGKEEDVKIGVLDVDCEAIDAFSVEEDRKGLEEFVEVLKKVVRWEL